MLLSILDYLQVHLICKNDFFLIYMYLATSEAEHFSVLLFTSCIFYSMNYACVFSILLGLMLSYQLL